MARCRRKSGSGLYHVFARGINHEVIFKQGREKKYFKKIVKKYLDKYEVEIYAYCIMPTHIHFIIKSENIQELSMFMSRILAEYAQYYNYKRNRNGHVFQGRFGSECIESEKYFWACLRYIHLNPVKACIVEKASDYSFSSINEFYKKPLGLVHEEAIKEVRKRFENRNKFLYYHNERAESVFIGMKDEVYLQQVEAAWVILWELQQKYMLENACEILEEPFYRQNFLKSLQEKLQISANLQKKIYGEIKDKIIN